MASCWECKSLRHQHKSESLLIQCHSPDLKKKWANLVVTRCRLTTIIMTHGPRPREWFGLEFSCYPMKSTALEYLDISMVISTALFHYVAQQIPFFWWVPYSWIMSLAEDWFVFWLSWFIYCRSSIAPSYTNQTPLSFLLFSPGLFWPWTLPGKYIPLLSLFRVSDLLVNQPVLFPCLMDYLDAFWSSFLSPSWSESLVSHSLISDQKLELTTLHGSSLHHTFSRPSQVYLTSPWSWLNVWDWL